LAQAPFGVAYASGLAMTADEAVAFAVDEIPPSRTHTALIETRTPLTKRELEIARLIAQDMTTREIAIQLFISERTVETHVTNMLNKLGLNSRIQLSRWLGSQVGAADVAPANRR
jgi:non-specific serine/threonine protein kinase